MAGRSTRNKLRFNVQSMINNCDKMLERLYHMELLGADRTEIFKKCTPEIVTMINLLKEVLAKFRSEF